MLLNVILSLIIIPVLGQDYFNFNGFIDIAKQPDFNIQEQEPARVYSDILDIKISAQSAIAVDAQTGKILYKKNIGDNLYERNCKLV